MSDEKENAKKSAEEDKAAGDLTFYSKRKIKIKSDGANAPQNYEKDWATSAPITDALEEKQNDWKMPEPIFRVSSGKTLNKSEKTKSAFVSFAIRAKNLETPPKIEMRSQPFISEKNAASELIKVSPAIIKNKTSKSKFTVVGLIALLVLAIVFLIGVYLRSFVLTIL